MGDPECTRALERPARAGWSRQSVNSATRKDGVLGDSSAATFRASRIGKLVPNARHVDVELETFVPLVTVNGG
jgi:hypothetical protein